MRKKYLVVFVLQCFSYLVTVKKKKEKKKQFVFQKLSIFLQSRNDGDSSIWIYKHVDFEMVWNLL